MIVVFNPKVPHVLTVPFKGNPKKAVISGSIVLQPGTNQVNDAQWEYMQTILKSKIESGEIRMVADVKEGEKGAKTAKPKTLNELEPEEAVKLVEQCVNINTLKEWKKIPKLSDEVRFAITKQIEEITVKGDTKDNTKNKDK